MINLNQLEWAETPNQYETYYSTTLGDGKELAYGIDWDNRCKANLVVADGQDISNSIYTSHWPVLDELFGREHWQKFLAEKQAEALAGLG